ncbi:MAG: acyltransferase [Eubacterium sp.]|nr:acyltransferase [Eubacterium sp.]
MNLAILRIVAMFMVISIHVGISVNWTQYVETGQYGVQLFFVLSGYLIFSSLNSGITTREFYKKRVLRIIPEYWTALVIYWVFGIIQHLYAGGSILEAIGYYNSPYGIRYLRYFTFTNMLFPSNDWYLWNNRNAWWTMSSFMVFYILAPVIHKLINSFWKSLVALTILLYFTPKLREILQYALYNIFRGDGAHIDWFCEQMPFCELYCFFFGIVMYLAVRESKQIIYVIYLLAFICVFNTGAYLWEIIMTLCIMAVLPASVKVGYRLKKIVMFMSSGSFSVYCIHALFVNKIVPILGKVSSHNSINFILIFCVVCLICYGYYWLYKYVERKITQKD